MDEKIFCLSFETFLNFDENDIDLQSLLLKNTKVLKYQHCATLRSKHATAIVSHVLNAWNAAVAQG